MNIDKHRPFFIGPMTVNTVIEVMNHNVRSSKKFGLIPSRRQVECELLGGGYVNKWDTDGFMKFVGPTLVLRDHSGPNQGRELDDGKLSLENDIRAGLKFIHIDPWKEVQSIEDAANKTADLIKFCESIDTCYYEIGTEAAIHSYTPDDLEKFLTLTKKMLGTIFDNVVYCVVQSGTQILGMNNIGNFDAKTSQTMCKIIKKFGLLAKEHNSDYLSLEEIEMRKSSGVDSLNIAPEFGTLETRIVLDLLSSNKSLYDDFVNVCYQSGKWKKWVNSDISQEEAARICGHYVFASNQFREIKDRLGRKDFDIVIREKLADNLLRLTRVL